VTPEFAALVARCVDPPPDGPRIKVTAECRRLGVSTSCFYKYVDRFRAEGVEGFYPRSRAPRTSPRQVSAEIEDLVVAARKELIGDGWDWGADSIRFELEEWAEDPDRWPHGEQVPSRATINRILVRRGQVIAVPQRKPKGARRRFEAQQPNECWQMDGFECPLGNGAKATVLHILDDCSRYELALTAMVSENAADVWDAVRATASRYGLPAWMLTDNGTAFSGRRRGWTSALEENLTALGVRHVTSAIRHPQTCGKCERAHQPAEHWLEVHGPYDTLTDLQTGLDAYRAEHNKRRRTHLGGLRPLERYALGPKDGPRGRTEQPLIVTTAQVSPNGAIKLNATSVGLGRRYAAHQVTVFRQTQHVAVFDANRLIAEFELKNRAGYQSANPQET
jgi:transposase InsO family protein